MSTRSPLRLGSLVAWHRAAALGLGASLLLYALTGWLFALPELGDRRWQDTEHTLSLRDPEAFHRDPGAAMPELLEALGVRARVDRIERSSAGLDVLARRPGLRVELRADTGESIVVARVRRGGPFRAGSALHGTIHYRGGLAFVLWAAVADLSAAALVLFAVTGVLLAWRRSRGLTLALLLPTTAFTVAVVLALGSL